MAPLERKNGVEKNPFWRATYGPKKLNVERFDSVKMMIPHIPAV